jgi:HAD superfamily hydrolase (TIGR01456 family)
MATVAVEEMPVRKSSAGYIRCTANQAKVRKQSANLLQLQLQNNEHHRQPSFGICFDIDGVLARGTVPIPAALRGVKKLFDDRGHPRLPVAFVTNSLSRNVDKASVLSAMLGVQVSPDQMIQAQGPLDVFTALHEKFCLIVGQGKIYDIAEELGFKNVCTVEDIAEAYPLLDVVDHDNRKRLATEGYVEKEFPKVEAVILLGEPKRWESSLQILIDVLRSEGRPNQTPLGHAPARQLPVVACNMDLQFQHSAPMPRYGHGAFLVCLEALYKKVTGRELQYTALVGKPSEITFRYAEHVLTSQSRKLGFTEPIRRMYMIGDTPDSDIVGSNLYQRYVDRAAARRRLTDNIESWTASVFKDSLLADDHDPDLPASRNVPLDVRFHRQTVESVESVLVLTGVYRPPAAAHSGTVRTVSEDSGAGSSSSEEDDEEGDDDAVDNDYYHGHRDFPNNAELRKPTTIRDDVCSAIEYILQKESFLAQMNSEYKINIIS